MYFYYVGAMHASVAVHGPLPFHSSLVWDPERRYQAWRYFMYMFVHIGIHHALFNILAQLAIGLPLEMVHRFWRIAIVYVGGVLAGSLTHSLVDPKIYLAGASGGVYSLVSAHLANLVINWKEMEFAWIRLLVISALLGTDLGIAIYQRYTPGDEENKTSYSAHVGGFVMGLALGMVILRNLVKRDWERVIWYISLGVAVLLIIWAVMWNILASSQFKPSVYVPFFRKMNII